VSAALGRVGLGLLLLAAGAAAARGHVGGSTGYAAITVSRSTVRYTLSLPTAALPSDLAEAVRLAQTGSQQNRDKLLDVLRRHIVLRANGTRCEPGPGQVVPSAFDATSFTMHLDFACGSASASWDTISARPGFGRWSLRRSRGSARSLYPVASAQNSGHVTAAAVPLSNCRTP
jgi:hypothetical protein